MDNNRKIAKWAGWEKEDGKGYSVPGIGPIPVPPFIDEANFLWEDTLFPLIEERAMQEDFMAALSNELEIETRGWDIDLLAEGWVLIAATPAQFSSALVRVIDEVGLDETTD